MMLQTLAARAEPEVMHTPEDRALAVWAGAHGCATRLMAVYPGLMAG